jgi:adenosylcobinamide-phosphate synthase
MTPSDRGTHDPEEVPVNTRSGRAGALLAGYAADLVVGDPRRWHPVAGFGRAALALERAAYAPTRRRGVAFTALLVATMAGCAELLAARLRRDLALTVVLWSALGGRSLRREALRVSDLLARGELERARGALQALCGRDADSLDEHELCGAAIESVAENTADAVVGALLWAAIAASVTRRSDGRRRRATTR